MLKPIFACLICHVASFSSVDPPRAPTHTIDLDLPPDERWINAIEAQIKSAHPLFPLNQKPIGRMRRPRCAAVGEGV